MGRDVLSLIKSRDSCGALDDATGWRAVEIDLHALASYVGRCVGMYITDAEVTEADATADTGGGGSSLRRHGDGTLLGELRFCSIEHVNRHAREALVEYFSG